MKTENAFIGWTSEPTAAELAAALGARGIARWEKILGRLEAELELVTWEWNSYSPKAGWAVRVKKAKRNIVYLSPLKGGLVVSFVLGAKAVAAAEGLFDFSTAPKYPEGTGVRIEVRTASDIDTVIKLAAIKLAH